MQKGAQSTYQIPNANAITPLLHIPMNILILAEMSSQMHQILPRIQFLPLLDILATRMSEARRGRSVIVMMRHCKRRVAVATHVARVTAGFGWIHFHFFDRIGGNAVVMLSAAVS